MVTFAGTVAPARPPRGTGTFAIALTVQQLSRSLVDLGLPAAMIRRREEVAVAEERAVTGLAAAGATAVAALLLVLAYVLLPALGIRRSVLRVASVTAVALPLYTPRIAPRSGWSGAWSSAGSSPLRGARLSPLRVRDPGRRSRPRRIQPRRGDRRRRGGELSGGHPGASHGTS